MGSMLVYEARGSTPLRRIWEVIVWVGWIVPNKMPKSVFNAHN